ncbi:hypothetical protein BH09VER1_BH09VER1_06830 [soil metagenome]
MNLIEAFGFAWNRMVVLLFRPFDFKRWFLMGFSAWLASFLTGGNSLSFNTHWPSSSPSPFSKGWQGLPAPFNSWGAETWIPVIATATLIVIALIFVFVWLGCRGQFMLLDNVVKGRSEVRVPWREFRVRANSLFRLYALAFVGWLLLGLVCCGFGLAYFFFAPRSFHSWTYYLPYFLDFLVFLACSIVYSVALFFVRDFGVLWMYLHGGTAWEAARKVLALSRAYPSDFLLYLCVRIVIGFATLMLGAMFGCLTCCLGYLPYLNSVVTLPFSVFRVWYAVECFSCLGAECDLRVPPPIPPTSVTL